jgi:hypothetical protein
MAIEEYSTFINNWVINNRLGEMLGLPSEYDFTLKYVSNSLYDEKSLKIPCVFSDYIYKNMSEQSIETGEVIGYFKKYTLKDLEKIRPNKDEIILLNETPEVIPDVRGIIITQFQTPLSHLVILAKN